MEGILIFNIDKTGIIRAEFGTCEISFLNYSPQLLHSLPEYSGSIKKAIVQLV